MFFNPPAERIVDVAVAFSMVQLFDTHFGQAVFGIVMVILGTAGGLFAAGTSVFVVAVIALSLTIVFFACQPAVAVVFELGVQASLSA